MDRVSLYHKCLRSTALVVSMVLLFDSGLFSTSTREASLHAQRSIANVVGVFATVPENELNAVSAALEERSRALDMREREIEVLLKGGSSAPSTSTYVLSVILLILLALIVLNYILDFLRGRRPLTAMSTGS